ncbi:uncharacterized protein K441DRAFT_659858 [Cenococcum geophilum 1.58]|uniref:uncharacterized protein n=1 Tax=Cenococcum geophilum 1.58 TaxID=794803 RepID=UPI00358F683D|nr:hypothetical protein K441DRAFT_659858 [Cenococcum geophilum 1.58]
MILPRFFAIFFVAMSMVQAQAMPELDTRELQVRDDGTACPEAGEGPHDPALYFDHQC